MEEAGRQVEEEVEVRASLILQQQQQPVIIAVTITTDGVY